MATRLVPRLMAFVARWNSRELFLLSTTTLAFGVGYVTWSFGLSMALGAFVAGLVINESEYAHQALSDIVPLRDLFGMLFFVSVGMLLDPALVWQQLGALVRRRRDRRRQSGDSGRRRAGLWLLERRAARRRPHALSGRRVCIRSRPCRTVQRRHWQRRVPLTLNAAIVTMVLTPAVSGLTPCCTSVSGRVALERHSKRSTSAWGTVEPCPRRWLGPGRTKRRGRALASASALCPDGVDDRRVRQARVAGVP